MIQNGAKLVVGPQSIVEELPESVQALLAKPVVKSPVEAKMSPAEEILLALLSNEEKHIDTLIENSRLSPAEVSATLVSLELRGMARQVPGKIYLLDPDGIS